MAVGTNITGINSPESGDTSYVQKIVDSFTAVDNHDHSSGKGLPIQRIAAGVVTATELASNAVTTTKILDDAVTTSKILNANVTTSKLANASVTQAKRAIRSTGSATASAGGIARSASSGAFTHSSTSYTNVTNLEVTITTLGNPVRVSLDSDLTGNGTYVGASITTTGVANFGAEIAVFRDGVEIATFNVGRNDADGTGAQDVAIPSSSIQFLDEVSAGTYVYRIRIRKSTSATNICYVYYAKLVAYEI